jgi:hypothetical protein
VGEFPPARSLAPRGGDFLTGPATFPSKAIEDRFACAAIFALMNRQPDSPVLPHREAYVRELVLSGSDYSLRVQIGLHLLLYFSWDRADLVRARSVYLALQSLMSGRYVTPFAYPLRQRAREGTQQPCPGTMPSPHPAVQPALPQIAVMSPSTGGPSSSWTYHSLPLRGRAREGEGGGVAAKPRHNTISYPACRSAPKQGKADADVFTPELTTLEPPSPSLHPPPKLK